VDEQERRPLTAGEAADADASVLVPALVEPLQERNGRIRHGDRLSWEHELRCDRGGRVKLPVLRLEEPEIWPARVIRVAGFFV
jgi:hypothetical protein